MTDGVRAEVEGVNGGEQVYSVCITKRPHNFRRTV